LTYDFAQKKSPVEYLASIIGWSILLFITPFLRVWVMGYLWVWFITPIFGMVRPAYALMYGLYLFVQFLVIRVHSNEYDEATPAQKKRREHAGWVQAVVQPLAFLLFGWLTQRFFL